MVRRGEGVVNCAFGYLKGLVFVVKCGGYFGGIKILYLGPNWCGSSGK